MGATTLGPCHYSEDMSEEATLIAVRTDGTGWIPICEEHKSDAESDGYTPQEVVDVPDAMEQNKDMPAPDTESDSDDEDGSDEAGSDESDSADDDAADQADQGTADTEDEDDTEDADETDTGD